MEIKESGLLTTKEVAKILNCSEGTLHNHRSRIILALLLPLIEC